MIVYHFCCKRDAKRIMKQGLTLGHIPKWDEVNRRWVLRSGFQWVTLNDDPDAQSWDTHYLLRYSRTEMRLTIDIPKEYEDHLLNMREMTDVVDGIAPELYEGWSGSNDWRVYRGSIPKAWIIKAETM